MPTLRASFADAAKLNDRLFQPRTLAEQESSKDYFLKITGIEGESADAKHFGEIDVLGFSFHAIQPTSTSTGAGLGTEKVSMSEFRFSMQASKASPKLFLACASGQHFPEAKLTIRKACGEQLEYYTWKLVDCVVSYFQTQDGSPIPLEVVGLAFAKIQTDYRAQKADGTLGPTTHAGWDLVENKKL